VVITNHIGRENAEQQWNQWIVSGGPTVSETMFCTEIVYCLGALQCNYVIINCKCIKYIYIWVTNLFTCYLYRLAVISGTLYDYKILKN